MSDVRSGLLAALLALGASVFIMSGAVAAGTQRDFASPEEATQALVQALKAQDRAATLAVLGKDAASWISSGDTAADQAPSRVLSLPTIPGIGCSRRTARPR
jgi:hypothetical protein